MLKPSKLLLLSLTLAATPVFAFNLGDAVNSVSSMTGNSQATGETGQLLKTLSSQLGVTQPQATGGTAALLGLAKNNLEPSQFSELTKSVPGLEQLTQNSELLDQASSLLGKGSGSESTSTTSLLNNTKDMGDVTSAFNNLGMNAETLNKFAPTLLDYMGKQGLSEPLMKSLTSLWGV